MLASLQRQLLLGLALSALQSQHNLLGGLGLLVEDGLGLTTVTALLPVVTTLTLSVQGGLWRDIRIKLGRGLMTVEDEPCRPCTASPCAGCACGNPCPCKMSGESWER